MGSVEVIFTTIHALSKKSISLLHWNSNLFLFFIKKDNNNITTDTIEKRRSFCTCEADWPRYQKSRRKKHKEADFIPLPTPNHSLLAFPIHSKISFTSLNQPVLSRSRRGFDEGALRQGKTELMCFLPALTTAYPQISRWYYFSPVSHCL